MARTFTILRWAGGLIFLFAGLFKASVFLSYAQLLASLEPLSWLGMPVSRLLAVYVVAVEVIGGISWLLWNRFQKPRALLALRVLAALMALNMVAAIFLVGIPAARGHAPQLNGRAFGAEWWRLPLEIFLLAIALRLALSRKPNR